MLFCTFTFAALLNAIGTRAGFDLGRSAGDGDLTAFVTRPEIKVPRLTVQSHRPDQVVPGYFFVAPYTRLQQPPQPPKYYQACQTGPAIYDQSGELIWSGACFFKNQNAFDFRSWTENGTHYISMILFAYPDVSDYKGHGVILDNTFSPIKEFFVPNIMTAMNMHEFHVLENGTLLYIPIRPVLTDFTELNNSYGSTLGLIADLGIREVDLHTEKVLFEWWASDHISPDDSSAIVSKLGGPFPTGWNWIHLNSIDKNSDGDYMVSARYTNAIYKISGRDGSLLWTLGGQSSSFRLDGNFNFSRQHDARFIRQNDTTETISFLDNGADENGQSADISSALVVTLDKVSMTATVAKRWTRPDGKLSRLRGNFQLLSNDNAFVGWSDNGVISEFSSNNDLLMEASFASDRLVTYRSYKFNFTSNPTEPPVVVARAYGASAEHSVTVFYVSWNGATEVATWEFYRVDESGSQSLIGRVARSGFETMLQVAGYERNIFAQAKDSHDVVLGRSEVQHVEVIGQRDHPQKNGVDEFSTEDQDKVAMSVEKTEL